jgi:two-component system, OmpR family, phosphate regulon sensor histidine kinase PhoR
MQNLPIETNQESSAISADALASILAACGGDPKEFLRRCFDLSPGSSSVIAALMELPQEEQWWLARASSADAEVRAHLMQEGFDAAAEAHSVDLQHERARLVSRNELHVIRSRSGVRLIVLLDPSLDRQSRLLHTLSWALLLFEQGTELTMLRGEQRRLQQRLQQVRAGLRAGVQATRAFDDLASAGRWLVDLRNRFAAHAAALLIEDPNEGPLLLSEVQSTGELQHEFLSQCLLAFAEVHSVAPLSRARWQNLGEGRWGSFELHASEASCRDGSGWPSLLNLPVRTPRGDRAMVSLGARLPHAFAPESVEMLRSAVGAMAHGLSLLLDQEQRRRHELQRILQELPVGLMLLEADGGFSVVNHEARQLLELRQEVTDLDGLESQCGPRWRDLLEEVGELRDGQVWSGTVEVSGHDLPLGVQARSIVDAGTGRCSWLVTVRDVSDEQRRERARSEFVSTVGHELKTPLTSMQTALELLESGDAGALSDDQMRFVRMGLRGMQRLEHRVEQLLNMARQEAGRLILVRETADLVAAIEASLVDLRLRSEREGRSFVIQLPARASCYIETRRVGEIVENLVGNAFKFCPRRDTVTLALRSTMPCPVERNRELAERVGVTLQGVEMEVRDAGEGMSPSTVQHAFDPFYQEGDPLSDRPEGAGLGLSIVRSLVDAHDGEIGVETAVGEGTTVRVWIPATIEGAAFQASLKALRSRVEAALRRGEELAFSLYAMSPQLEEDLDRVPVVGGAETLLLRLSDRWVLRCSLSELVKNPARVDAVAEAHLPADGRRVGTLLAELMRAAAAAPLRADDSWTGKAPND